MEKLDGAWPWGAFRSGGTISVCRKCKGFLLSNPRFAPQDLKACAEQAGVRIKVYCFSPQENCFASEEFKHTERIPRDAARVLYDHKPKRLTVLNGRIYVGQGNPPPPAERVHLVEAVKPDASPTPGTPAPKESQLVN